MSEVTRSPSDERDLYARVWRWHFFAGLCVAPFGIVLALSGSVYLFNPQIEAWIQSGIDGGLPVASAPLAPEALVASAVSHVPDGRFTGYRLPSSEHATARVEVRTSNSEPQWIWVNRGTGEVAHAMDVASHPMQIAKRIHGELLTGSFGSVLVELAACWMIVLLFSGLYLAWPRGRSRWASLLRPRFDWRRRASVRSFHTAVGLTLGGFMLVFLLSGLPWTGVFGTGLSKVEGWAGVEGPGQEFRVTLQSGTPADPATPEIGLDQVVARIESQGLADPIEIRPPGGSSGVWTVRSMTQRRPDRVTLHLDRYTSAELMRIDFDDYPRFKQVVSLGIALHEGALFGPANQILGLVIALGVVGLCVTGPLLWWKRRPRGLPLRAASPRPAPPVAVGAIMLVCGLLPLVGASLLLVWALERAWARLGARAAEAVPTERLDPSSTARRTP